MTAKLPTLSKQAPAVKALPECPSCAEYRGPTKPGCGAFKNILKVMDSPWRTYGVCSVSNRREPYMQFRPEE